MEQNKVLMSEYWREKLKSIPFKSKGRGRMTKLLKQKSKIGRDTKPRKTYDADLPMPRPRDPPPNDRHEEEKKQGGAADGNAQGQQDKQQQHQENQETIETIFSRMAQNGDDRVELGNTGQPARQGRTMGKPEDVKMTDNQKKKMQANRMKSKDPVPPEQTI